MRLTNNRKFLAFLASLAVQVINQSLLKEALTSKIITEIAHGPRIRLLPGVDPRFRVGNYFILEGRLIVSPATMNAPFPRW